MVIGLGVLTPSLQRKYLTCFFLEMLLESCLGDEEGSGRCTLCFRARAGVQHNQYFLGPRFWDTYKARSTDTLSPVYWLKACGLR